MRDEERVVRVREEEGDWGAARSLRLYFRYGERQLAGVQAWRRGTSMSGATTWFHLPWQPGRLRVYPTACAWVPPALVLP